MAAELRGRCVDISPDDFNISSDRVAEALAEQAEGGTPRFPGAESAGPSEGPHRPAGAIRPGVLAVIAPHMFGTPCDVERLAKLCLASGTLLIEDVAQACGARVCGRLAGTFGEFAFLSLGRSKNLRGPGGGVLLVNRADLAPIASQAAGELSDGVLRLGAVGKQLAIGALSRPKAWNVARRIPWLNVGAEDQTFDGNPSRLAAWKASLGLTALRRLDEFNARRARLGRVAEAELAGIERVRAQAKPPRVDSAYVRLATSLDVPRARRDAIVRSLQAQGIDAWGFYSRPLYGYDWWPKAPRQEVCPEAERVVDNNLVLPLYHAMTEDDVTRMVESLRKALLG
jgi:perosamine synthetase